MLARVKAGNASEKLLNDKTNHIFFVERRKGYLKSIQQYNQFNKVIKQSGYYIYVFWE